MGGNIEISQMDIKIKLMINFTTNFTGFGVLGLAPRLKFDCSTLEGEGVSVMAMSKE